MAPTPGDKSTVDKATKELQRETRAMNAIVNQWVALSPRGRAYLLPQLVAHEEAHRDDG